MNNALITWITETEANCSIAASYTPKEFQLFSTLKENKSPTAFPRQCVDTGNNKETTPPPFPQFLSLLVECAPHSDLNHLSLSPSHSLTPQTHTLSSLLLPPPPPSASRASPPLGSSPYKLSIPTTPATTTTTATHSFLHCWFPQFDRRRRRISSSCHEKGWLRVAS